MNNTTATQTITIHPSNVGSRKRWLHETGTGLRELGILEGAEVQLALIRLIEGVVRAKWRDDRGRLLQHIEVVVRSEFDDALGSISVTARTVAWEMPDGHFWVVPTMSQSAPTGALHPQNRRLSRPWVRSATPVTRFAPDTPHRAA
jgi:hypothetical protein